MIWKKPNSNIVLKLNLELYHVNIFFFQNSTNNRQEINRQNAGLLLSFKSWHHFPFIYSPIKVCLEMITMI